MLIKQMQYSPLQTEKDRVSEWGSFRYAVFCCMEMLLYLSSPYKYGKMYKSPRKKKAGMGDEMTFRTSDILIRGSLIIIGLTEIAHLAGCLLGWSFLTVTDLLLAEVGIVLLAADRHENGPQPVKMIRLRIKTAGQTRQRKKVHRFSQASWHF